MCLSVRIKAINELHNATVDPEIHLGLGIKKKHKNGNIIHSMHTYYVKESVFFAATIHFIFFCLISSKGVGLRMQRLPFNTFMSHFLFLLFFMKVLNSSKITDITLF